jgi:hypothetical protein
VGTIAFQESALHVQTTTPSFNPSGTLLLEEETVSGKSMIMDSILLIELHTK